MMLDSTMIVRFPARTWEQAHEVIAMLKESPPGGYKLIAGEVKPRGIKRSGRRCNVRLVFNHNDCKITRLATSGAKEFFGPYAMAAQGVA